MSLSDFQRYWLFVFFYPSNFTFIDPTELAAVADTYPLIKRLSAYAVAISTDSVYSHKIFHDTSPCVDQIQFPLLSDRNGQIARSYGVWNAEDGAAERASFIIDPKGTVRYYSVYPREVGRNIIEIVRTLQGAQYSEDTGEALPAGWESGMPGIKRRFEDVGNY